MSDEESQSSFLSEETERKIAEFKAKLEAEQAAMPDTSIRSGTGKIDAPQNYYFDNESIPIYNSSLNKRIDRVDMEVDRAKRARRTQLAEELSHYEKQLHADNERIHKQEKGENKDEKGSGKTASFIYVFPAILVVFGIVVVAAMSM